MQALKRLGKPEDVADVVAFLASDASRWIKGASIPVRRASEIEMVSHYNIRRVVDIYASVQDRDLGAVGRDLTHIVNANADGNSFCNHSLQHAAFPAGGAPSGRRSKWKGGTGARKDRPRLWEHGRDRFRIATLGYRNSRPRRFAGQRHRRPGEHSIRTRKTTMKTVALVAFSASVMFLAGCTVGPKYVRPSVPAPPAYKEAPPASFKEAGEWQPALPGDQGLRGKWWEIFGDPELNTLEDQVTVSNQDLKAAEARFREARSLVRFNHASEFPTISVAPSASYVRDSNNTPAFPTPVARNGAGDYILPIDLSYEIDLWGRVRRTVAAAREETQATAADLATASLSLHAELAMDYFELRSADTQKQILDDTVRVYKDAYRLTDTRFEGGASPRSDVAQAKTQLDDARVQDTDVTVQRAAYEHAIAVLMRKPPAEFSLASAPLNLAPPNIPVGVPSQKRKGELSDFQKWTKMTKPNEGDDYNRVNGAGEMLVFSAADFEDFLQTRPDMPPVYEEVNREVPFDGLHSFFDHCETISDRSLERVKALGGGIAVQNRMAFQGEYFVERYSARQAKRTPPIRRMLEFGIPVGAGTDATRVSSYNPFLSLYWLVTGRTVGGLSLYPQENRVDRVEALRLYTLGSSWFSTEDGKKGAIAPGQLADLALLSADYCSIPEEEIKRLELVLTIVGGKVVYSTAEFSKLAPPELPVSPDWSPVKEYGGYTQAPEPSLRNAAACQAASPHSCGPAGTGAEHRLVLGDLGLWSLGCDCFAF
jgi:hypothetical protein